MFAFRDLLFERTRELAVIVSRELARTFEQQIAKSEHDARASRHRALLPRTERFARGRHREIDVAAFGEQHVRLPFARRGIPNGSRTMRGAGRGLAADMMRDRRDHRFHEPQRSRSTRRTPV
jgi:hypothetical protein